MMTFSSLAWSLCFFSLLSSSSALYLSKVRIEMSSGQLKRRALCENIIKGASSVAVLGNPAISFASSNNPAVDDIRGSFESISTQTPTTGDAKAPSGDVPFRTLPSGVKIKEFKSGSGDTEVKKGSKVWVQATGRMLNLNGVKFYSTKASTADPLAGPEPLILSIGNGTVIPGLEEGMIGMKKGSIRRIVIPASLGYTAGHYLEPIPQSKIDRNAIDSVVLNPRRDASLLWDIQVERIK